MAHLFNVGTNELLPKKKQPKIADAIPILVYIVCKGTLKKKLHLFYNCSIHVKL
jgi:hypothetical protein